MGILIVVGSGSGRCRCGHRVKSGEEYVLIEGVKGDWTLCMLCGEHLRGRMVHVDELRERWFKGKVPAEMVCAYWI